MAIIEFMVYSDRANKNMCQRNFWKNIFTTTAKAGCHP